MAYRGAMKHYVRVWGWLPAVQRRAEYKRRFNRRTSGLRYFTLCGADILDVKFLAAKGLLERNMRGYPGVAFCECESETYAEAATKLGATLLPLKMTFEEAVSRGKLDNYYPFDVYNLDFSRSCFPQNEPPTSQTIDAVTKVIAKQSEKKAPFDLFFTFVAGYGIENQAVLRILSTYMEDNFAENPSLRQSFEKKFGMRLDELVRRRYHEFILVTFPKLIAFIGQDYGFSMTYMQRFWYKRERNELQGTYTYYITKFVFSFDLVSLGRGIRREERKTERLRRNYLAIARESIENDPVNVMRELDDKVKAELEKEVNGLLSSP